jgi:muramoyltetrapeptide carboxypeptidase LdcA involved in peptidoglycan recycling
MQHKISESRKIKPKKLIVGDKVAIVSLSSGILGEPFVRHQLELGIKRLKQLGLEPVFMPNSLKGIEFIQNNPHHRASDLKLAFDDESIKGIICAIGGDDTYKTIPFLMEDEEFKKLVVTKPKVFIGFSDSTNNHIMLNKLGLVTYYGLNFLSDLCELQTEMLSYTKNSYLRFFNDDAVYDISSSPKWYENRTSYDADQLATELKSHTEKNGHDFISGIGKITGLFWGGCLDSIYDIYTSERYKDQRSIYDEYDLIPQVEFFKDKILFLETSEEKPEPKKFTTMLNLLVKEGVLQNIKCLLFGKPYDEIYYYEYRNILSKLGSDIKLPIVYNLNFGHALPRAMIPYGVKGEIDFDNKTIKVTENIFG